MGRAKKHPPPSTASSAKERHRKAQRSQYDPLAPVPEGFIAKPPPPKTTYTSYFEFVENKDKKKKLEFKIATKKTPPPGFEFVPIGNPQLTTACKELSRDKDAMIFIVSNAKDSESKHLAHQVHRIGHHIRQAIVEEAKNSIVNSPHLVVTDLDGKPEPIPEDQAIYHAQADAAIRDLFPRIPNTDRQLIIEHAFTRGSSGKNDQPVGLSDDITLARRVQLAVLAHIRHTHTRYDVLLKETSWQNARKVVEDLCLDILVKWRGDEETGRDQLDEILREVVVISDSEGDSSDDESTDNTSVDDTAMAAAAATATVAAFRELPVTGFEPAPAPPRFEVERRITPKAAAWATKPRTPNRVNKRKAKETNRDRIANKKAQKGFKRYRAWEEAIKRVREGTPLPNVSSTDAVVGIDGRRSQPPTGMFAVLRETPETLQHDPDSRIHSRASGSMPSLTGFVSPQRPAYTNTSWYSPSRSSHDGTAHFSDKVRPIVYDHAPSAPSMYPTGSTAISGLQDVLVRSIEPPSPHVLPSFVRPLPPRSPTQSDPHSPRSGFQQRPGMVSHYRERICPESNGAPANRMVLKSRPPQTSALPSPFAQLGFVQTSVASDHDNSRPINRGANQPSHLTYTGSRTTENSTSVSAVNSSRRIILNANRPGERSNPILMEDRGGFYERISVARPDTTSMPTQPQSTSGRQPTQEFHRTLDPHSSSSWDDRSRSHTSSHRLPGVEIAPMSNARGRMPSSRVDNINPLMTGHNPFDRSSGAEARKNYADPYHQESRPALGGEHSAVPPQGYWVVRRRDDDVPPPQYHHQRPVFQHNPNEQAERMSDRYDLRRRQQQRHPTQPDLIVLE